LGRGQRFAIVSGSSGAGQGARHRAARRRL